MPIFPFDRAFGTARNAKGPPEKQGDITRGAAPDVARHENQAGGPKRLQKRLKIKRQELSRIQQQINAGDGRAEVVEYRRQRKRAQQELFQLERELRAAEEGQSGDEPGTGALPDFVIIGARKAGTTFLYNLLSRHPHVEPVAAKELHYFDNLIEEEDIEWYRRCFPKPRWKDGQKTITGEATPYLAHSLAAERMARVVPQARLIALLRNPVDRAYSDYQHVVKRGQHRTQSFEEAIQAQEARSLDNEGGSVLGRGERAGPDERSKYLSRGIYADQLERWLRFFADEQLLVLKSEDLFGRTPDTFRVVREFLGLPAWEPATWEEVLEKRNRGAYRQEMDPDTRRRLEEFFEPHNRRLYELLGIDFGW